MKEKIYVIIGRRPLLLANGQAADPTSRFFKEMAKIRKIRTKTEEHYKTLDELCWQAQVYWDNDLGIFIPSNNLFQMFCNGAAGFRKRPKFKAGLTINHPIGCSVIYEGPKNLEQLRLLNPGCKAGEEQPNPKFRLRTMVPNKTGGRTPVVYPKFFPWSLEIPVAWDPNQIDEEEVDEVIVYCGQIIAVGGWRPVFGTFDVKGVEIEEKPEPKKKTGKKSKDGEE